MKTKLLLLYSKIDTLVEILESKIIFAVKVPYWSNIYILEFLQGAIIKNSPELLIIVFFWN